MSNQQANESMQVKLAALREKLKNSTAFNKASSVVSPERSEASSQSVSSNQTTTELVKQESSELPLLTQPLLPDAHNILGVTRDITLNTQQQLGHDKILAGESICVIGAAGTGKTTMMRKTTRSLIDAGIIPNLSSGTKHLAIGNPGIVIVSYTRKATNNIRHAVVSELRPNTLTCHKLIEYAPVWYEVEDPETGSVEKKMRFEPTRHQHNPLPDTLRLIIYEESSMLGVDLYTQIQAALPHKHQEIFLGDIQQLPPTFGSAILGYKLLSLPVVELTEVYRQAAANPGLALAWDIISGDLDLFTPETVIRADPVTGVKRRVNPSLEKYSVTNEHGSVKFQLWQKPFPAEYALKVLEAQFNKWIDQEDNYFNPTEDIILCPFNVNLGTVELNKGIAQHLGKKRNATVHEVIAGFNKHYLAVGDRVLYDKEDAFIIRITPNREYLGTPYQPANKLLTRWGNIRSDASKEEISAGEEVDTSFDTIEAIEAFMEKASNSGGSDGDDRVNAASHLVTIRYAFHDQESEDVEDTDISLETASEINSLLGGYVITVHKSQGSEYRKVFLILHSSHATMVSRELLYTAITRMREEIHIICEANTFSKGVRSQRIKGNTLQEKAESFKGKPLPAKLVNTMREMGVELPNMPSGVQELRKVTSAASVAGDSELQVKLAALRNKIQQQVG